MCSSGAKYLVNLKIHRVYYWLHPYWLGHVSTSLEKLLDIYVSTLAWMGLRLKIDQSKIVKKTLWYKTTIYFTFHTKIFNIWVKTFLNIIFFFITSTSTYWFDEISNQINLNEEPVFCLLFLSCFIRCTQKVIF